MTPNNNNNNINNKSFSKTSVLNSVTAGYVAGICGTVVGHPLDSIKVLMQTNQYHHVTGGSTSSNSTASSCSSHKLNHRAKNNMSTLTSTMKEKAGQSSTLLPRAGSRSLRALYAGISGPLLTVGMTQALMFSMYDTSRRCIYRFQNQQSDDDNDYLNKDPLVNVFWSATMSCTAMSVVTGPMQVIKTKQQIMVWSFKRAVRDTSSIRKLFVGYRLHAFCSGLGRGVYMTTYEYLKRYLSKQSHNDGKPITLTQRALCAATSGTLCWALIFPVDVIRSRIYAQSISSSHRQNNNKHNQPQGIWNLVKTMYRQGGNSLAPFYRGFWVTVARAGPVAAAVLPIYDLTLESLQLRQQ